MAVDETKAQPANVNQALVSECHLLEARIKAQQQQSERFRVLADRIDEQTARDEHLLEELHQALGTAPQLRIDGFGRVLRGRRLEEVAVEILKSAIGGDAEIHYRDWYELLREGGHDAGGRDPLATFLAQLSRSRQVERVGRRTGRYRLRLAA